MSVFRSFRFEDMPILHRVKSYFVGSVGVIFANCSVTFIAVLSEMLFWL